MPTPKRKPVRRPAPRKPAARRPAPRKPNEAPRRTLKACSRRSKGLKRGSSSDGRLLRTACPPSGAAARKAAKARADKAAAARALASLTDAERAAIQDYLAPDPSTGRTVSGQKKSLYRRMKAGKLRGALGGACEKLGPRGVFTFRM